MCLATVNLIRGCLCFMVGPCMVVYSLVAFWREYLHLPFQYSIVDHFYHGVWYMLAVCNWMCCGFMNTQRKRDKPKKETKIQEEQSCAMYW